MKTRRREWTSREEVFSWFSQRAPWNVWNPRALQPYSVRCAVHTLCPQSDNDNLLRRTQEHALRIVHEREEAVALMCDAHIEAHIIVEEDQMLAAMA